MAGIVGLIAFMCVIWVLWGVYRINAVGAGCLLYTSDAADERSSVDLGGRRIIKKKKHILLSTW